MGSGIGSGGAPAWVRVGAGSGLGSAVGPGAGPGCRVLYDAAKLNHDSLFQRMAEEVFASLPIRFEDDPSAD